MSAGFTPGPWSFDGPASSRIVWAGADHRVCFLTSDGPNLANARLIAAAPALYEALEECREYVEGYEPYNSSIQNEQMKALAKLDAALKLARGEA